MGRSGDPTLTFTALPVQEQLFDTLRDGRFRIIGFGGGIRGTKTWGSLAILVTLCKLFPRSRWAVVRKDLPTLRRNTIPSFDKLREQLGGFVGELNQSTWTYPCANGSEIIVFSESLDIDPDLSRWKGLEVNGFLLEEADELAEQSFHKAIERAGAWIVPEGGVQPPPYVICTFNPCANWPKHVFYEPWQNGTIGAPYAFIPATAADNPYIPELQREAWKQLPEQEYRRFVQGDWDVLSGRYYDVIDQRVHLAQRPRDLPPWWTYWGAFDWGYAHWAVFGAFAQDGDGTGYLLDTVWQRRAQDEEYATTIKAVAPKPCLNLVYAGHDCWQQTMARGASGVTTAEVFAKAGILLVRADIDRVNGGRAVRRTLSFARDPETGAITRRPKVYVVDTPGNRRLLDQLSEIMPDENNVEKPAKIDCDSEGRGGDDGADMFRYGIASHKQLAVAPTIPIGKTEDHSRPYDYVNKRLVPDEPIDRQLFGNEQRRLTRAIRMPRVGKR